MATRFECLLEGSDPARLRAMAEALLDEVDRTERVLSYYDPESDLSRLNRQAGRDPTPVSALLLRTLLASEAVFRASRGAFDPVVGALMTAWGLSGSLDPAKRNPLGRSPSAAELEEARASTGWHHVHVSEANRTARIDRSGVSIDFGGIGKGVALDEARWAADELGIERGLIHGGTSSVLAIGGPFTVGIEDPGVPGSVLKTIELTDAALGVSSPHGKVAATGSGHVLDIRTGEPVTSYRLAAVVAEQAALADAWATALTVNPALSRERPAPDGIVECHVFQRSPSGAWTAV